MTRILWTAVVYLALAVALCGLLPPWLDEVLQLIDTSQPGAATLLRNLPANHPGSSPLGYLAQQAVLRFTGDSVFFARLPSAVFAAGSVLATGVLAAELGIRSPWLAGLLLGAFPLTLRYAAEGRAYSQALFFSVAATLLYLKLHRDPRAGRAAAYCVCLVLAVYTQPYAASVGAAHLLWSLSIKRWRVATWGGAAVVAAAVCFLPWFLWAQGAWRAQPMSSDSHHFAASAKMPMMIFREIAGAGYWGSALLLILCLFAVRRVSLLSLLVVVPVAAAVAGDFFFDYFLAARQFLWALPALAVLAAAGMERAGRSGRMLGALLLVVCSYRGARYFTRPHEDWAQAAAEMARLAGNGACVRVLPEADLRVYRYFQPALGTTPCDQRKLLVVVTPYTPAAMARQELDQLRGSGYIEEARRQTGLSTMVSLRALCAVSSYCSVTTGSTMALDRSRAR
jgi:hypothetical protein